MMTLADRLAETPGLLARMEVAYLRWRLGLPKRTRRRLQLTFAWWWVAVHVRGGR